MNNVTSLHDFRIRSLNCHRSHEVILSFLNHSDPLLFDILCIQEPPPSFASLPSLCPLQWDRILPTSSAEGVPIKCFMYVSKRLPSCSYNQIRVPHSNITAIRLEIQDIFISLFNVYNPPSSSQTIETLASFLRSPGTSPSASDALLLLGDFNKHDALWEGPDHHSRYNRCDSDPLIDIILHHGLELCFEPGTPTFFSQAHSTWSTLDLMLASSDSLIPLLLYCRTFSGDASDHLGLEAEFAVSPDHSTQKPRPRFRETDWKEFAEEVPRYFKAHPLPTLSTEAASLDSFVEALESGLVHVLAQLVPSTKVSGYRSRWWTAELSTLRKEYRQAQRRITKSTRNHPLWTAMREARNRYLAAIRRQKRAHWREFLAQLTQAQLWTAARYTDDTPKCLTVRTPALQGPNGMVSDTLGKSRLLFHTFFPSAAANYRAPVETRCTPPRTIPYAPFSQADIDRAIVKLAPYKAPGPVSPTLP